MSIQKILLEFEPNKENLLAAAKAINKAFGYVSAEGVEKLGRYFGMKPSAVYSAISFYDQIKTNPPAQIEIRICDGANCALKRSEQIIEEVERFFGLKEGDKFNPKVHIKRESCFGMCLAGPIMMVNGTIFEKVAPERVDEILRGYV